MGQITPYVEAPRIRVTEPPASGGMETSGYDHLRQGVSIRNDRDRYAGVMPILGTGRNDHVIEVQTYGQGQEFSDDPLWELVDVFDPVKFIVAGTAQIFPVILANATILDPERAGGFIEPFPLPARNLISIDGNLPLRGIKGSLMAGNEDTFQKTDLIDQFICDFEEVEPKDVYIDSSDTLGTGGGDITIPGFFPEEEKLIQPFDESQTLGKTYVSGSANLDDDMRVALLAMTGSTTDRYVPIGCNSAGTGFTYDNTPGGVDSIAFGGLKR